MEVPLAGSGATRWIQVSVPAPRLPPAAKCSCPAPADAAGAVLVPSDSNKARDRFVIWRVHQSAPSVMEVVQLSAQQDIPSHGLRLSFEDPLCPFADVLPIEVNNGQGLYFSLTMVTTSGVVYVVKLPVSTDLWTGFVISSSNSMTRDLSEDFSGLQQVTAFAAAKNILFAGGQNGSVLCFSLFTDSNASQNICYELKGGDAGLGRLWGLVSRTKTVAAVRSLGVHYVHSRAVLFSLHEDGGLQAWDPLHHARLFSHNICPSAELAGCSALRTWIEDGAFSASTQIAVLFDKTLEYEKKTICMYSLDPVSTTGLQLGLPTLQQVIPLDEYKVIDAKLVNGSLWVLKQSATYAHELIHFKLQLGVLPQRYHLQEEEVCEQLVSGEDCEPEDQSAQPDLLELYLRRLLQPRVFHHETVQDVFQARGASINDTNLRTFTEEDWRRELTAHLGVEATRRWTEFIVKYISVWKRNHTPYALLSDATTGCMGLVRKTSLSLIRLQTRIERASSINSSPIADGKEGPVLTALLGCTREIRTHVGSVSLALFDEALLQRQGCSVDQLVATYVQKLNVGQLTQSSHSLGLDDLRQRAKERHMKQRIFNSRISRALVELRNGAGGWEAVFDFITGYEKYLLYGSTQKLCRISTTGNALTKLLTQASSQVLWAHYEEARNLILLLKFVVNLKHQVNLAASDAARIQRELYPRLKKIMIINLLLYWLTVSPGESPQTDDFNSLLSSLRLDGNNSSAWTGSIGFGQVTLAEILASSFFDAAPVTLRQQSGMLIEKGDLLDHTRGFITWLSLGEEASLNFSRRIIALSIFLLQHGQYRGLERFLAIVEKFSNDQTYHDDTANAIGESSARLHLFGLCILARTCSGKNEARNLEQIKEASSYFFRAADGLGDSSDIFHSMFSKIGQQFDKAAQASWKLHYFEWVMQIFEQYNLSESATEFALAAVDQVDKASNINDVVGTKGRLWANIFKFSMDLDQYGAAYSAITSNPDVDVKLTCLRRFVVVLCEKKAIPALCGGDFPYAGLLDVVEQELAWKAEYSDVSAKPSPYKLLYGFHILRRNNRRAAECMYRYAVRMRDEGVSKSRVQAHVALEEQVFGLAAAINALSLVSPSFAWLDGGFSAFAASSSPSKRLRLTGQTDVSAHVVKATEDTVVDIEELEKQYVIAAAKLELVQSNVKHPTIGELSPSEVVALLVQNGLYKTAFSVVFKLWKDSFMKRELEKVFELMSRSCCTTGLFTRPPSEKILTLPDVERLSEKQGDLPGSKSSWHSLQTNLEKYRTVHARLPVIVAETILSVNKNMELPLWLVEMLKGERSPDPIGLGMAGQGDPAALLRIYLDNGRLLEASMLVLDYLRAWSNMAPTDILKRKQMSAAWFPYLHIERLLQALSELGASDLQCAELRTSLQTALDGHLKQMKEDSDDVLSLI